ncbi:MAG: HD family phosphohydrolase [Sporichthyaceae bacterium]
MGALTAGNWTVTKDDVLTDLPLLDELLDPHREDLGIGYWGYRAHCYRMVNWARFVTAPEPFREEKLAIMTVLHDLPFFLTGDLDYLGKACDLATDYLKEIGREEWTTEMHLMIDNHHKMRSYTGPHAPLVEACRKADWIDVTFTKVRFGIPRSKIVEVRARFPMNEAYKSVAMPNIAKYASSHLRRPLPMMRW